jgi:quinol monooxygenase YgiN
LITIVTHTRVSAGNAADFEAILRELRAKVELHEPEVYCGYGRSVHNADLFVVIEAFPDAAAQAAHRAMDYVAAMMGRAVALVEGGKFDVQRYES